MSASLVGSEMCIRDRPLAGHVGSPVAGHRPQLQARPATPTGPTPGHGAVSYTHLTLPTICSV
eukprot:4137626-Alexandrium_andersonii.AAC.1